MKPRLDDNNSDCDVQSFRAFEKKKNSVLHHYKLKFGRYPYKQWILCHVCSWSQLLETLPLPNVSLDIDFKCLSYSKLFL